MGAFERALPAVPESRPWKLFFELSLYLVAAVLIGLLALFTATYLLRTVSEAGLAGGLFPIQGMVLALIVLTTGLRLTYLLVLAAWQHLDRFSFPPVDPERWPRVSILVPAFNEEESIRAALESSLRLDYPDYEIVFVDDGSTDETLAIARELEGRHHGVDLRVFTKPNAGKWSAHNLAFREARGELILCVDADSRLERDSLRSLVRTLLADPKSGGVAGQVRVRNRVNLLTCLQALEYLSCNGATRSAQSKQGCVLVVPGPIGLFRREVVQEVWDRFGRRSEDLGPGAYDGPYEHDTFAEDFDFSVSVIALGHRVLYEPAAISNTKAPETVFALLSQRYRWQRGSIQVLRKLWRRSLEDPDLLGPGVTRWILLTYGVDLVLVPIWLGFGLPYVVATFLGGVNMAANLISLFLVFMVINCILTTCFASIHGDQKRLSVVLPFHDLYQTLLLQGILGFVIIDEIRGAPMRWS